MNVRSRTKRLHNGMNMRSRTRRLHNGMNVRSRTKSGCITGWTREAEQDASYGN